MFRRHRAPIAAGCLLAIGHQVSEALVPVVAGWVIGNAVATSNGAAIGWGIAAILGLFAVLSSSAAVGYYLLGRTALVEVHRLRVAALRRILTDPSVLRTRRPGELLSITSSDAQATTQIIQTVSGLIASGLGLAVAAFVLLRIDLVLGFGLLVAVGVLVAVVQLLGPYLERRLSARQEAVGLAAATAADLLAGLRSLRGFGGVAPAVVRYRGASRISLRAAIAATTSTALVTGVGAVATGVLVVLTAVVASQYALSGSISLADLITVIGMAAFLLDPVSGITRGIRDLAVNRAGGRRVAELFASTGVDRFVTPADRAADAAGEFVWHDLTLADHDPIELTVAAGELIGVVLVDLSLAESLAETLTGERAPVSGAIRLGGRNVGDIADADLRSQLLVEPHAVHLLGGSVAAALDTGSTGRGRIDVDRALSAASVQVRELAGHSSGHRDLAGMQLLDRGANLSGGQRQRVALARALHADRDVLVLRDPTSAVDAVTEDAIAGGLRRARDGSRRTLLLTSSPLLLARCDRVLFIDEAGVVRIGTHAELSEQDAYRATVLR